MNKYQEALDTQAYIVQELEQKNELDFVFNLITSMEVNSTTHLLETTLQELVDKVPYYEELEAKATPKKPINDKCPSCQSIHIYYRESRDSLWLVRFGHCPHCGQALKWSNNE